MKWIATTEVNQRVAHVYWNREWEEFVVKLYVDGEHVEAADYHTCDKQDALDTAGLMVKANELVCYML